MKHLMLLALLVPTMAIAGQVERKKAWALHSRIAGVPPAADVLNAMEADLMGGNPQNAAYRAMQHQNFLAVKMKNFFKPWSNAQQTQNVELNDFVALAVGMVRDNRDFRGILSTPQMYINNGTMTGLPTENLVFDNTYFNVMEQRYPTTWPTHITPGNQNAFNDALGNGAAGAISTRAFGAAYFSAGTNRRMTRFLFKNFLCKDFEQLHDTTIPDYRVRRDVERNPGNDSRTYRNKCVGCHAGQDAIGGAWAYYEWSGQRTLYSQGGVTEKMNKNGSFFPTGHVTQNDSWINLWATGQNASLGWSSSVPTRGNGAASLGTMLANSRAFGECMASRVFELVCMHKPKEDDANTVQELANNFMGTQGYNMRALIASTATKCVSEEEE